MQSVKMIGKQLIVAIKMILLTLSLVLSANAFADEDILAIGDGSDNTVKFFDAKTGQLLQHRGVTSGSGGLHGPRGVIFDRDGGSLIVSNQNVGLPVNGDILRYNDDGRFLAPVVSDTDPNSPFAPDGIVIVRVGDGSRILFVADLGDVGVPGKLLAYRLQGMRATFLANLDPNITSPGSTGPEFHPRGLVLGPDGSLYVSLRSLSTPCGGTIARFDPMHLTFKGILLSNSFDCNQNQNDLHRPDGLVFGPDGKLYITSFRKDATDTDKILIISSEDRISGQIHLPLDRIDLDVVGQPRAFAQALLFGPDSHLYVPISSTGEVRRYNVVT
jgi:sugar lactone lactonase YvrE